MKRELLKIKARVTLLFALLGTTIGFGQSAGFNSTFVVVSLNGGADVYYDLQAATGNPDFNNANLGTYCPGAYGIVLKGGEHNNYKCGGCDITETTLYYRVTTAGAIPAGFSSVGIGFNSDFDNGCGGKDQQWKYVDTAIDLTNGLTQGDYKLEVFSSQETSCSGTQYADNGGAYFAAYFSIGSSMTYYQDADADGFGNPAVTLNSCSGAPVGYVANNADCNDNQLQYQDTDGDGYGSSIVAGCGVTNNADCNDNQLQYQDVDNDGFGRNVIVACGVTNNSDCDDNNFQYQDLDGDGYGSNVKVSCGVTNNWDANDNLLTYLDIDGDGFGRNVYAPDGPANNADCDDNNFMYLDADGDGFGSTIKVACGVYSNNDCDDNQLQYQDVDGDGYGRNVLVACGVTNNADCDDNNFMYLDADGDSFGSTIKVACGVYSNNDCDDNQLQYQDADGDGFGRNVLVACGVLNNADCDDNNFMYLDADGDSFGSNIKVACGVYNNNDCDDHQVQFLDADGDGFGRNVLVACGVLNNADCDDNNFMYLDADGDSFGSTIKVACGVYNNNDCDDNQLQYQDGDGDGFGRNVLVACGVLNNADCDDNNFMYLDADGDSFGSTTKVACGVYSNNDCDDNQWQYQDADGDGFGKNVLVACGVTNNADCDDNYAQYLDADGDGYGSATFIACGGVYNNADCDDSNRDIHQAFTFYTDADGDGYGAINAVPQVLCAIDANTPPTANLSPYNTDCNDNDSLTIAGPSIDSQPTSTFICATTGSTASLAVLTSMTNPTYEWQYRVVTKTNANPTWITITSANAGTVYSNYTSATLAVTKSTIAPAAGTEYRAMVSGGCGSITSNTATISIITNVKGGTIASATSVCLGSDLTLTLTKYAGTSFQWQSAPISTATAPGTFTDIPGAIGTSYTIVGATNATNKSYRVIVTNSCNNTTATSPTKTIKLDPTSVAGNIISGGGVVCAGSTSALKVTGYVGKIQWEYSTDGENYTNAPAAAAGQTVPFGTTSTSSTMSSYLVTGIASEVYFRAKVTSGTCSSTYTAPIHYTLGTEAIAGTISPENPTLCPGTGTSLTLSEAVGVVTWQKASNVTSPVWTAIPNSNILSIATGNLTASTAYRALVTIGTCSTVSTNIVVVNVVAKPVAKPLTANATAPTGASALTAICSNSGIEKILTVGAGYEGLIQWQVSTTSATAGFANIDGATSASYIIANPSAGANYYRVKMYNTCGAEVFGTAKAVYYQDCTAAKGNTTAPFGVIAYPNPYTENFNISVTTSSDDTVGVSIYDMTGRQIEKRDGSPKEVSEVQIGTNFPSGVYTIVVIQGIETKTLRVIKR